LDLRLLSVDGLRLLFIDGLRLLSIDGLRLFSVGNLRLFLGDILTDDLSVRLLVDSLGVRLLLIDDDLDVRWQFLKLLDLGFGELKVRR
jgi:hypothetical protein